MPVILSKGDKLDKGHYTVVKELGVGGMGVVYLCRDELLLRDVAIKMLLPELMADKSNVEVFKQEARLAAQLEHPNIVRVYDIGVEELHGQQHHYVVMEYLPGGNLAARVSAGALPVEHALNWMKQLANGLAFAHKRGVVHQDVKADNIFITNEGDLKIGDFGLARLLVGRVHYNASNKGMGTPAYMSPELCRGEQQDHRSDCYSLGILFFEMATGQLPYRAKGMIEMAAKHSTAAIPSAKRINPLVPEVLDKIILRMMGKTPEERPQSLNEVLTQLDDLVFELRVARLGLSANGSAPPAAESHPKVTAPETKVAATAVETKPAASVKVKEKKPEVEKTPAKEKVAAVPAVGQPKLERQWIFSTQGPIGWASAPVLDKEEQTLYVASSDGNLYSLDAKNGQMKWKHAMEAAIVSSPVLSNHHVLLADSSGTVSSISVSDGAAIWKQKVDGKVVSTPVLRKDSIFVPTMHGDIIAIDAGQGKLKWKYQADKAIVGSAHVLMDHVLFGTRAGTLYSLSADKGKSAWKFTTAGPVVASPAASVDSVYVGTQTGAFYALDSESGRLIWEYACNGAIVSRAAIVFTSVVFCSNDRWLYCCEKYDGRLMWKAPLKGKVLSNLVTTKESVVAATRDGWIQMFNARTGELKWQKDIGSQIEATPLVTNNTLYACTVAGEVLALSLS